ncbi:MAG TPA: hypothetical protein VIB62_10180 [Actinomycetota bacterium]
MADGGDDEVRPDRIILAATVVIGLGVVIVITRWDRAYRRWQGEISPLLGPRTRVTRWRSSLRGQRANAGEFAGLINEIMDEVARANDRARRGG